MRRTLLLIPVIAAIAVIGGAIPVGADWLVTRDGARMETRGPWKAQGKLVVFTTAEGNLASLRSEQLDLEASRLVTQEAKLPPPAEPKAKAEEGRKSVIAITDAEVAKVARPKPPAGEAAATQSPGAPGASPPGGAAAVGSPVKVANWQQQDLSDRTGLEVSGLLRNDGDDIATETGVTVSVFDETGALLTSVEAVLISATIEPRGTTRFRAPLPRIFTIAKVSFDVRSKGLRLQVVEPESR
jgi:hypothetical protein